MVPAHVPFVEASHGWAIVVLETDDGVSLTINVSDIVDANMLQAIGFIGFMTLGAHHEAHHWAMATGQGH